MLRANPCILGQVVGGNMSVTIPLTVGGQHAEVFEMFGGKKLSPRWTVKSVDVSNGIWVRQPSAGTDDLSFKLKVTSYGDNAATANVRSITLVGPTNAASIEDAFK